MQNSGNILLSDPDDEEDDGYPMSFICDKAQKMGIKLIPVIRLTSPSSFIQTVKDVNKQNGNGACLRINSDDFEAYDINSQIERLSSDIEIDVGDIDLILDLDVIQEDRTSIYLMAVKGMLVSLSNNIWRTLTIASAAFPLNLTNFDSNSMSETPRADWQLWEALIKNQTGLLRLPAFGDYGIAHPDLPSFDPRMMRPSASIRYTAENYWLIVKGSGVRREGFGQFHDLCDTLVQTDEYCGEDFSKGDKYIKECAKRQVGPGNLTTWRRVGTNHHLKFVIEQIASLF